MATDLLPNGTYDVAIAGAGLAGASLALRLARRGLRMGVLTDAPRFKAYQRLESAGLVDFFDFVIAFDDAGRFEAARAGGRAGWMPASQACAAPSPNAGASFRCPTRSCDGSLITIEYRPSRFGPSRPVAQTPWNRYVVCGGRSK